jgi:hypothetical protein
MNFLTNINYTFSIGDIIIISILIILIIVYIIYYKSSLQNIKDINNLNSILSNNIINNEDFNNIIKNDNKIIKITDDNFIKIIEINTNKNLFFVEYDTRNDEIGIIRYSSCRTRIYSRYGTHTNDYHNVKKLLNFLIEKYEK